VAGPGGDVDVGGRQGDQKAGASLESEPAPVRAASSRVRSRRLRLLAGCLLVVVAALILVHEAESGVRLIANQENTSVVSTWKTFDVQQQCLRDAITHRIPRGSRVHISSDQSAFQAGQLAELSIPWATPVVGGDHAAYRLAIVRGAQCDGEALDVQSIP
jgi:hypothetical protein